jgi:hypothetical protein
LTSSLFRSPKTKYFMSKIQKMGLGSLEEASLSESEDIESNEYNVNEDKSSVKK